MPPKIMFRIFFYRMEDAQNDNAAGLGYVAPAALRRNPVDATPTPDDMPMPAFFGSRLADADAVAGRTAKLAPSRPRSNNRCRLTVIAGGTETGLARQSPAPEGSRI
jgi:hypothetical protein